MGLRTTPRYLKESPNYWPSRPAANISATLGRVQTSHAGYYQTGDTRDRQLRHEYARSTCGLAAVRWPRGLRARMLGPAAEPQNIRSCRGRCAVSGHAILPTRASLFRPRPPRRSARPVQETPFPSHA
jgi:hypothetical protein